MSFTVIEISKLLLRHQRVLQATTLLELKKRYSGSLLGFSWVILYPLLFLCVYLFLYLAVFKVSYPKLNTLQSIIYIFSGLVPYIAFMEAINSSAVSIKQNMHLIKNIILPVELIPTRMVTVALFTQFVGLFILFVLCAIDGTWSLHLLLLPVAILIETLFLLGLALIIAPLGVLLPDTSYFINLLTLLLLFLSPIGFMILMLPHRLQLVIDLNPIYYMLEPFRETFLVSDPINTGLLIGSFIGAFMTFSLGAVVFKKFKNFLADYE